MRECVFCDVFAEPRVTIIESDSILLSVKSEKEETLSEIRRACLSYDVQTEAEEIFDHQATSMIDLKIRDTYD